MSYFIRNGNIYRVIDDEAVDLQTQLPIGNYIVQFHKQMGYYLEKTDDFEMPAKLYGNTMSLSKRILDTFKDRPFQTGVWLNGEKGSGKTLLARTIAIEGRALGYPTLIVNSSFYGDSFNKFMQDIDVPAIVIFDEFEKVYASGDSKGGGININMTDGGVNPQEQVLTLLDGVMPTKKLFIMTTNDGYKVNVNMKNRPGRLFYAIDFKGLGSDFIREYCQDVLINKSFVEKTVTLSIMYSAFNFDMLKALCEEINRYGEEPIEAVKFLNARPEDSGDVAYDVSVFCNKEPMPLNYGRGDVAIYSVPWKGNIFTGTVNLHYFVEERDEEGDRKYHYVKVGPHDIIKVDSFNGRITYQCPDDMECVLILERKRISLVDYAKTFGYDT